MPDNAAKRDTGLAQKALELAYSDAIQPAAKEFGKEASTAGKELGKAIDTLARAVNVALSPLRGSVWAWEKIETHVVTELGRRFGNKPDRLVTPKANIAVPALEAMRYSADEPELRTMYMNLLETAMDKEMADRAHPAFPEIIRQMTPDEARVFGHLVKEGNIRINCWNDQVAQLLFDKVAAPAGCQLPHLFPSMLGNLQRLELVGRVATGQKQHNATHSSVETVIFVTPFGKQFYAACVGPSAD